MSKRVNNIFTQTLKELYYGRYQVGKYREFQIYEPKKELYNHYLLETE